MQLSNSSRAKQSLNAWPILRCRKKSRGLNTWPKITLKKYATDSPELAKETLNRNSKRLFFARPGSIAAGRTDNPSRRFQVQVLLSAPNFPKKLRNWALLTQPDTRNGGNPRRKREISEAHQIPWQGSRDGLQTQSLPALPQKRATPLR